LTEFLHSTFPLARERLPRVGRGGIRTAKRKVGREITMDQQVHLGDLTGPEEDAK